MAFSQAFEVYEPPLLSCIHLEAMIPKSQTSLHQQFGQICRWMSKFGMIWSLFFLTAVTLWCIIKQVPWTLFFQIEKRINFFSLLSQNQTKPENFIRHKLFQKITVLYHRKRGDPCFLIQAATLTRHHANKVFTFDTANDSILNGILKLFGISKVDHSHRLHELLPGHKHPGGH